MESNESVVQKPKHRKRMVEQKMAFLQDWRNGTPLPRIWRRHGLASWQMYKWRRSLERGLASRGELVQKGQVVALQRKVEELERALGRKTLEHEMFKRSSSSRGSAYPRGAEVADPDAQVFPAGCLPHAGGGPQWALLPAPGPTALPTAQPARCGGGHPSAPPRVPRHLWLPAGPCAPGPAGAPRELQDNVPDPVPAPLALLRPPADPSARVAPRRPGRPVAEPNCRWASDITGLKRWEGQQGRLAVIPDRGVWMVLERRLAPRLPADDLSELVREAVFWRFGEARERVRGIECFSDHGPA